MSGSQMIGLLQAHDRSGALVGRAAVRQWPAIVGRAITADLVLDDPHLAAEHLRIDSAPATGDVAGAVPSGVTVQVLDTVNGVTQGRRTWRKGEQFDWKPGEDLHVGRLRIALRLADEPLPQELPMPIFTGHNTAWTLALAGAVVALMGWMTWLLTPELGALGQRLPALLAGTAGSLAVWAGMWALATRLFTGRLWFWRHMRIACATVLAAQGLETFAHLLAFAFSWESLARYDLLINVAVAAVGVFFHLIVVVPQSRRGMAAIVAGVALMGLAVTLGSSWLQTGRLSGSMYMSTVFPPSWRLARAVPVPQFLDEAQSIRKRLEKRLKDKNDEDDGAPEPEEE
jgi:hypothetical protein